MSNGYAAPGYRRDLGGDLVLRWSNVDDAEGLALLMGTVWRDSADAPLNPRTMEFARRHIRGGYPLVGPGDCALVEATRQPGRPIVACTFLWHEQWAYEEIPLRVGRPENIVTHPDYRNRGLTRATIELAHARSTAEGHHLQAITGIPTFYRQFGYEYALDLHGRRAALVSLIPPAPANTPEPYTLRPATIADVPQIATMYNSQRAGSIVWNAIPEHYWRYLVEVWGPPDAPRDPAVMGVGERIEMIVDAAGAVRGYALLAAKRWDDDLSVAAAGLAPEASLPAALPALLRGLHRYGEQLPVVTGRAEPLRTISFGLGRAHPLNAVLGQSIAPIVDPPYAWYIRVPDLPAFLALIAPALERRLAASPAAGYSGALTLSFYRAGLRLTFEAGRLTTTAPWQPPAYGASSDAGFPALVFLQLLFGYRSLGELRHAFPDVSANDTAALLLGALFPARPSWVLAL